MLQVTELYKSYGGKSAVAGVSLSVRAGEIVGLLGPNGAGKSTTVAMICGIVKPDRGAVSLNGIGIAGDTSAAKARIGFVPQDIALHESYSTIGNLRLFGALYGVAGPLLAQRIDEALTLVGLVEQAHAKPATFSGGMKRRLNIACALLHDPDVLVLDEPTVGVDPQSRNAIFDNLETLRARGKALIYTTHYMEEVERLCDRVVIIDRGTVIAADTLGGLHKLLPQAARRRAEIEGVLDAQTLEYLAARGVTVKRETGASLEDIFLHLTGRALRDGPGGKEAA
jgi:ABC-2 type transport system ATP-binding protein